MALVALLDANVLWSAAVRDTLLSAAEHDLFRPAWSRQILDEMARNLKARRTDLNPARIDRTVNLMLTHFPEALVENYEHLISSMGNHPGDRHVLAAAVHAEASTLVTWNVADFPMHACDPYGIDVQTPDDFLVGLWHAHPHDMTDVLRNQADRLKNPPMTADDVLDTLNRSVPKLVATITMSRLAGDVEPGLA